MFALREMFPLLNMIFAIFIGAKVGNVVTTKTSKKYIGWPVGILIFLVLFTIGSMLTMRWH